MANTRKTRTKSRSGVALPAVRPAVAGIDIGSTQHWVCAPPGDDGEPHVRVFGTTTPELEELVDWLAEHGVTSAAMESTYVYWIPLYELLESRGIEPVLVNARQLHNVLARKTDFSDCQWLQQLHSCGLLRGSFRPTESIARLRALQRQMANLVAERTRCVQWMQKSLDHMNVQVHRAVTDITGQTGMAIVRAIVAGERDATTLAALRDRRCRKSTAEIARHLTGTWRDEHLFNLASALRLFDTLGEMIAAYDQRLVDEIKALQTPERADQAPPKHPNRAKEREFKYNGVQELHATLWRFAGVDLTRIDGINAGAAQVILTEVGANLTAFPSEKHFVSWLRLCPRTPISGGKPIKKRRNGLGANRIAGVLRMAATSLQRSKTAVGAAFRRIARHKGGAVAVFAIARHLAQLVYRMLRHGQDYTDIGAQAYEAAHAAKRLRSLTDAARDLGYSLVEVKDPTHVAT
jgi:transposase